MRYAIVLALCASAAAGTLNGTVRNATTGQPAAGDEVILLRGGAEIARAKTDGAGRFRLVVAGGPAPHLVRVVHRGAAYYKPALPGASSIEVQVYDLARQLDGITAIRGIDRLQAAGDQLQVVEEIVVRNASNPPRLLMNDRPFEIQLPADAEIIAGAVEIAGGQPLKRAPSPGGEKGRYYFPFPLPPGESRFAVAYRLPYRGSAVLEPKVSYPLQQFAVLLPKSMHFESKTPGVFRTVASDGRSTVQQMAADKPGQPLAFRVSTTDTRQTDSHPRDRWVVLGGLALVLAAGTAGLRAHRRKPNRVVASLLLAAAAPLLLDAFPSGPPAGVSGAPGEATCARCHSGGSGGGKVEIAFPAGLTYTPGVRQQLTIAVTDVSARVFGFQLSARIAGDNSQAGTLAPGAGESGIPSIRVICSDNSPQPAGGCPPDAIAYIEHSAPRRANTFGVEWTPPATDRGPLSIYVAGNAANGDGTSRGDSIYTASYTLRPQAGLPAGAPRFTSAGLVNAASFTPGMSPGAFLTIFGENLAPRTQSWDGAIRGTALPTQLEGVSVTMGGKPAYLAYLSPGQLNVLLPPDDLAGSVEVKVTTAQGSSSATSVIQRYAPAFFPSSLDRKYIAATHADAVPLTSRPAQPGEEIVLWGTGFGPTAERLPSGQVLAKAYSLANPADLKVTIGGRAARVTFAGVTLAGVYQINVVVPAELTDGDHAVLAEIGAARTQDNVFLAVQGPAVSSLVKIEVAYKLDFWLISGNYGSGFWASPPVLGPATQGGPTFTVEARAQGFDAQGRPLDIRPRWTASDPAMVTVMPGEGQQVTITVQHAGQSTLRVTSQGVTKEVAIRAADQGSAIQVEIDQ